MNLIHADLTGYLGKRSPVEPHLRRLLRFSAAPVVFDIGACEGEDSIRYARMFPNGRIYAFEPLCDNQRLIRANFAKYSIANAELLPTALSDQAGRGTLHVSSGTPAELFCGEAWNYGNKSNSLLQPASRAPMYGWVKFEQQVVVECDTVDSFCAARGLGHIDFMHMDVQGAEYLVLQGAREMLPRTLAVWLEVCNVELYRGQKLREDIERYLEERGFCRVFEERRGVEGDQLYVNTRYYRARVAAAACRISDASRAARRDARAAIAKIARIVGLYHPLRDVRSDFSLWRRARRERRRAASDRRYLPDHLKRACLLKVARERGLGVLVETGTFHGDTIFALRRCFQEIHSIELARELYVAASRRLAHLRNVHLHFGDSAEVLPAVLRTLRGRPALFWLDGHYCAGGSARGTLNTPIRAELDCILARPAGRDVILIDDARLFTGNDDYPDLEEIRSYVAGKRPRATFEVIDDIVRIYPV